MLEEFFLILRGASWTVSITLLSLAIGLLFGFPIMLLRSSRILPLRVLAITVIALIRAIPPIVWIFIVFFGLGTGVINISPFAAALAGLGVIAAANMAEIYRGGLISIQRGQWEAAKALNLKPIWTWRDIILPQMLRVALPASATYAIGLLKDSAIASTIGVTDIAFQGARLTQETFEGLRIFAMVGLIYILLSLPIAWLSRKADFVLRAKVAR
jgi:polar amino acid transport system permease protein